MKMTSEQLKEIITSSVQPLLDAHGKTIEDIKVEVDEKIKEFTGQLDNRLTFAAGQTEEEKDPKGGFKTFSHFAKDVAKAELNGYHRMSPELKEWDAISKAADATTLEEGEDQFGGFLIPPEFKNELWLAVEQKNEILARCTRVPMARTTLKIPFINGFDESGGLVYGGIQWKWTDELATKTPTRPKIGRITLDLKKLTGLAYSSDELLEDSPISMETLLKNGFRDGLNFTLNDVFINGLGAGMPLGVLSSPCLVSVAAEVGQFATTIVYENIIKMFSRMYDASNAVWFANQNTLPQLATMSLAVGAGGAPVWLPMGGASGKPYDTLMGRPMYWCKHCPALGTIGDIIFVDWSQYLVGQKAGYGATGKFESSIHFKFDADQTCFRFVFRIDGQPWWPSALTPPKATGDTLSPFVALASR